MRVFLTGASGFIGAHVMRALLARGHSVVALVMPGDPTWRLKDVRGQFAFATGLLGDTDSWRAALSQFKPDVCIHLAWFAEPGKYLHSVENIASMTGSLSLLHEVIEVGCQRVVMAGTCAEYDSDMGYLREDGPTRPATLYAAAKLSCCLLGQRIAETAKINLPGGASLPLRAAGRRAARCAGGYPRSSKTGGIPGYLWRTSARLHPR